MIYILFMHLNINVNDMVYDEKFRFVEFSLNIDNSQEGITI